MGGGNVLGGQALQREQELLKDRALRFGKTWEVAAWEIAHLGRWHYKKYHWEVAAWAGAEA